MTGFAARPNGTVETATNKITFKSFTFTTQTLPVVMIAIQEKLKNLNFHNHLIRLFILLLIRV